MQADFQPGDTPRYGAQANIENHPQITDFVPRRRRTVVMAGVVLAGIAAGAAVLAAYAEQLAALLPAISGQELRARFAGGTVAWFSAVALALFAVFARVIHMLRRHRVDDEHGRYRVWQRIAAVALLASLNSVAGFHETIAAAAKAASGWSLTSAGHEWWILPLAVVGGWLAVRVLQELSESRISLTCGAAALVCYGIAAVGTLGWSQGWLGPLGPALTGSFPLVGHAFALSAAMLFARHVVLDVQGLIETPARAESAAPATEEQTPSSIEATAEVDASSSEPAKPRLAKQESASGDDRWVDGSVPIDEYDEDAPRKLSKAERKRLRKQNDRRNAA